VAEACRNFYFQDKLMLDFAAPAPAENSIAALRRQIYSKDVVSRADFLDVLALPDGGSPDHARLLGDVAVDLLVHQADPPQYVSPADADWLIAQIKAHKLPYGLEIQLLTDVLRYAVSLPSTLSGFCQAEIEMAIVEGRDGHPAGQMTAFDVEALRQTVYAADEGAKLHVTRPEAESLFRIAHATAGQAVDPAFDVFFAEAVGNHLMGVAFHGTPSAADELQLEHFENAPETGVSGFLNAMFSHIALPKPSDLESVDSRVEAHYAAENAADARKRARAEEIDQNETIWFFAHLTRGGAMTSAERSLLAFLKKEVAAPPKGLSDLFAKAGI
jgi:hypothetical protein